MKNISRFDIVFISIFVVVALMGGGAWMYLSGLVQTAQDDVGNADKEFKTYSTKYHIVVSASNGKTLKANIELIKAKLEPLIHTKLRPTENKLHTIEKEDPVAWKHDLDDEVNRLATSAKLHGVILPPNFYFGFSRYIGQSPSDEQTAVLSKQLIAVEAITTILNNAPVKAIRAIRRSYEEEPHTHSGGDARESDPDHLAGFSLKAPGDAYIAYPFEVDFETTAENLRPVVNNLIQSPYLFVIRTLTIKSSSPNSPLTTELDKLAGPPPASVVGNAPGQVAANPSAPGPQFLFGNATIRITARIDMIEWNAEVSEKR